MSNLATVIVCALALVGLETIGMDGMIIVLCWLTMLCLGIGFVGECLRPPRR